MTEHPMQMYLKHFNLSEEPFSATPDTRFYYEHSKTQALFSEMIAAINQADGFVRIMGEAGSGKTLQCRKLLKALRSHKKRYQVIHIPHSRLSEEGLYLAIMQELKLKPIAQKSLRESLIAHLQGINNQANTNPVIIIDESQSVPEDTLEALIELIDSGKRGMKLLRAALFSMPLEHSQSELITYQEIADRTTLTRELKAFDSDEVKRYIETRLIKAGYRQDPLYSTEALELIVKLSKGVPRLINLLAQKSLINAYNAELNQVQAHQVRLAAATIDTALLDVIEYKPNWFNRLRGRKTGT